MRCQRFGCFADATHRVSVHRGAEFKRTSECEAHSGETYADAMQDLTVVFATRRPFAPLPIRFAVDSVGAAA